MQSWNPGNRVAHATFGTGTVIELGYDYVIVHFDDHGRKKMATKYAVLSPTDKAARAPEPRRAGSSSERPTDPGYENLNEQVVQRRRPDDGSPAPVYELKCRRCGTEYGAAAADILLRRCPSCMGGPPGV